MWEQTVHWLQWYPWKQTSSHKTIPKYTLQQQVGHILRETLTDTTSLAIEEIPNALEKLYKQYAAGVISWFKKRILTQQPWNINH